MQYYIYLPGDSFKSSDSGMNVLGETSFKTFYAGIGFKALLKIVETREDLLEFVQIKTSKNQTLTVEEFLSEIESFKILKDY